MGSSGLATLSKQYCLSSDIVTGASCCACLMKQSHDLDPTYSAFRITARMVCLDEMEEGSTDNIVCPHQSINGL